MNNNWKLALLLIGFLSLPAASQAGGANAPFQTWGLPILEQSPSTARFVAANFDVEERGTIQHEPDDKRRMKELGKGHFRVKYSVVSKLDPKDKFIMYLYTRGLNSKVTPIFKSVEFVPVEDPR